MLGSVKDSGVGAKNWVQLDEVGRRSTHSTYLVVSDATAAHERSQAAEAEFTMELQEIEYGGKAFGGKDGRGLRGPWVSMTPGHEGSSVVGFWHGAEPLREVSG